MADQDENPEILDEDRVLRRIPTWPDLVYFDEITQSYRITSAAFTDKKTGDREVSATHERLAVEAGRSYGHIIGEERAKDGWGLVALGCGYLRNELEPNQVLEYDPVEDDPHHTLIVGEKKRSTKKKMALNSKIVIQPSTMNSDPEEQR